MRCQIVLAILIGGGLVPSLPAANNWPAWRGPRGDGCVLDVRPPQTWSADENVAWKTPLPGRGHSSPIVDNGRIFLTTADEQAKSQSVMAFGVASGQPLWERTLFKGGHDERAHERNSQASCTIACDGDRLCAVFLNDGGVWVTSLDYEGTEIWRRRVSDFTSFWGYSASPCLHGDFVIVAADHADGGAVTALDRRTGRTVWSTPRPKIRNYTSPIIHHTSGADQLLMAGCERVIAYDPHTGRELWTAPATTKECVGTVVVSGDMAFASGGFPKKETAGVRTDGSGEIVWRNKVQAYVPSLLAHDGFLFGVTDTGIAYCWNCKSGREQWKQRLGGTFNASPILAGALIYAAREDGTTIVFRPTPEKFDLIAKNKLGTDVYSTPTFVEDCIYLRIAQRQGEDRQEWLYSIRAPDRPGVDP